MDGGRATSNQGRTPSHTSLHVKSAYHDRLALSIIHRNGAGNATAPFYQRGAGCSFWTLLSLLYGILLAGVA